MKNVLGIKTKTWGFIAFYMALGVALGIVADRWTVSTSATRVPSAIDSARMGTKRISQVILRQFDENGDMTRMVDYKASPNDPSLLLITLSPTETVFGDKMADRSLVVDQVEKSIQLNGVDYTKEVSRSSGRAAPGEIAFESRVDIDLHGDDTLFSEGARMMKSNRATSTSPAAQE